MKKEGDVPEELNTLGLTVSYDMGWQKRSTGGRYDSMSGHGFIIGCRSKKIIGVDVRGKNTVNVIMQTSINYRCQYTNAQLITMDQVEQWSPGWLLRSLKSYFPTRTVACSLKNW